MRKLLVAALWGAAALTAACHPLPDRVESSFDFRAHAFTFINFDEQEPAGLMTPALAARMFGDAAVCATGTGDTCVPNANASIWLADVNGTLANGHSEGMAVLSQLFALGKLNAADFGAEKAALLQGNNAQLLAEIAYFSATQRAPQARADEKRFAANEVMPFLAQVLQPNAPEMYRLLIAMRDESSFRGGHSLVPFAYFKSDRDGVYVLRVYDPNMPAAEQRLFIDTKANRWSYQGSTDPEADPRLYEGTPENGNLLYFAPVSRRLGALTAPFDPANGQLSVSSRGVSVLLGDDTGSEVGFKDGKLVESGGTVVPGAAACACKAPHQEMTTTLSPDGGMSSQTIKITDLGTANNGGTLNVTGGGLAVKVDGVKTESTSDTMTVSNGGKTVKYEASADAGVTVTTTTKQPDGTTTTVTVKVDNASQAITVDASDPKNVVVSVENAPKGTNVSVTVTSTAANGTMTATSTSNATTQGKDAQVTANSTTGSAMVNNNIELEPCLNGKKDGMEADVDCGQACDAYILHKCALGKSCATDRDCNAPGLCTAGVCQLENCHDGRLNNREGDIDCGGFPATPYPGYQLCPPCGLGNTCSNDGQCDSGYCGASRTCVGSPEHLLEVNGLEKDYTVTVAVYLDGAKQSLRITGRTEQQFFLPLTAKNTIFLGTSNDWEQVVCQVDPNAYTWNRPSSPDAGPLTALVRLRCKRVRGDLSWSDNRTGCGYPRLVYPPGATINYTYYDTYSRSMKSDYNYNTASGIDLYPNPDGGLSYQVTSITPTTYVKNGVANTERCQIASGLASSAFPDGGHARLELACTCTTTLPDGGALPVDGGTDGGTPDAGAPDAGAPDAGAPDAGAPDAGPPDAGPPDAGTPDAGASGCQYDSDCVATNDCECGASSGYCVGNTGRCGAGRIVIKAPTADGGASSGTFTVPAGCQQVLVQAWGAAGGGGQSAPFPMPMSQTGGAGGYVEGTLSAQTADVFTVWVAQGGDVANSMYPTGTPGVGSYFGALASGGAGSNPGTGGSGGTGGGLTSVQQKRGAAAIASFTVPGGSGASSGVPGVAAGDSPSGGNTTKSGTAGTGEGGGGGAGENGGVGATSSYAQASAGAFGTLPSGLTSTTGNGGSPGGTANNDYGSCGTNGRLAGQAAPIGGPGGDGCVVLRCVAP